MLSNRGIRDGNRELSEIPLDNKEIKPVSPKGNQPWIFVGRTDAEAPILWLPDTKNWVIGKYPDAGKDWKQEEKETTEDEMVGRHHRFDGHEATSPGSWWWWGRPGMLQSMGHKESDTTERLNWTDSWICLIFTSLPCSRSEEGRKGKG